MVMNLGIIDLREDPLTGFNTMLNIGLGLKSVIDILQEQKRQKLLDALLYNIGEEIGKIKPIITENDKQTLNIILDEAKKSGLSEQFIDDVIRDASQGQLSLEYIKNYKTPNEYLDVKIPEQLQDIKTTETKDVLQRLPSEYLNVRILKQLQDTEKALDIGLGNILTEEILKQKIGVPNLIDMSLETNPFPSAITKILSLILKSPVANKERLLQQTTPILNTLGTLANLQSDEIARQYRDMIVSQRLEQQQQALQHQQERINLAKQAQELSQENLELRKILGQEGLKIEKEKLEEKQKAEQIQNLMNLIREKEKQEIELMKLKNASIDEQERLIIQGKIHTIVREKEALMQQLLELTGIKLEKPQIQEQQPVGGLTKYAPMPPSPRTFFAPPQPKTSPTSSITPPPPPSPSRTQIPTPLVPPKAHPVKD